MFKDKSLCSTEGCNNLRDITTHSKCKSCRHAIALKRELDRIKNGLCFRCGVRPLVLPTKSCVECNIKNARIRSGEIKTQPKVRKATCSLCSGPRDAKIDSWCRACRKKLKQERISKGICSDCGIRPIVVGNKSRCFVCGNRKAELHRLTRNKRKKDAIDYLGGQCKSCGLRTDFISVYDFHHNDPQEKDIEIARLLASSWNKILTELKKCSLLCKNCHAIFHELEAQTKQQNKAVLKAYK